MRLRTCSCILLASAALSTAAPRAHACSPPAQGVTGTVPAEGEKYPGNAAVLLQGQGISITDASVTVDGQPATMKDAYWTVHLVKTRFVGFFVEPTPVAGQSVVVTGTFCPPGSGCNPVTLHYQATAAFNEAPTPVDLVEVDVYDYPDFKSSGGDCLSDSLVTWWLHLKSPVPDRATEGAVLYVIDVLPSLGGEPDYIASGLVEPGWDPVVALPWLDFGFEGQPVPEEHRFNISTFNSVGNMPSPGGKSPSGTCHYRVDTIPSNGSLPAEPTWTAADIYPGGPCETTTGSGSGGGGGSGREDVVIDGCGCRVAGDVDSSASGLFGAMIGALGASVRLARRRR